MTEAVSEGALPFPFVVGCGRSGTTLLRAILDSHPDMAVPAETRFVVTLLARRRRYEAGDGFDTSRFIGDLERRGGLGQLQLPADEVRRSLAGDPPPDTPGALRRVFELHARLKSKSRYGNKTPVHVLSLPVISAAFPESRILHVIRDGRDVALSYLDTDLGPVTVEGCAARWVRWVGRGRAAGRELDPIRYREVRYEALVEEPEATVREVCEYVGLSFEEEMLRYFDRADSLLVGIRRPEYFQSLRLPPTPGIRDWRRQMAARDVAAFEAIAGSLLDELAYPRGASPPSTGIRLRARSGAVGARIRERAGQAYRAVAGPVRRIARMGRAR